MRLLTAPSQAGEEGERREAFARRVAALAPASLGPAPARPAKMANDGEAGGGGD